MKTQVVSLSGNLKKARQEAVGTKAKLNALRAAVGLATNEQNVALAKVRGERQNDVEA